MKTIPIWDILLTEILHRICIKCNKKVSKTEKICYSCEEEWEDVSPINDYKEIQIEER